MSNLKNFFRSCALAVIAFSVTEAQVFDTIVIIQNSVCIGTDCQPAESFGFATVKLKENNTQIRFEDTSTGTFPSTDWTIGANETNNNGKNLFFIDDEVSRILALEAGAPASSLYINPLGNIGMKTNAPATELHLYDGNNPTIRLEQHVGGGFNAQTWDIAGNETYFSIKDVNTNMTPLKIRTGAPNNSILIHPSGNISLGADTQNEKLYVNGSLVVNGNITALSDRRIKTNIRDLEHGLASILQLSAKQYTYVQDGPYDLNLAQGAQFGLIAQEVEAVIPELVKNDFQVTDTHGMTSHLKGLNYTELVPVLIKAIQEQQVLIEQQNAEISQMKSRLAEMEEKLMR